MMELSSSMLLLLPLAAIGGIVFGSFLLSSLYSIIRFSPLFSYKFNPSKAKWAVITGNLLLSFALLCFG